MTTSGSGHGGDESSISFKTKVDEAVAYMKEQGGHLFGISLDEPNSKFDVHFENKKAAEQFLQNLESNFAFGLYDFFERRFELNGLKDYLEDKAFVIKLSQTMTSVLFEDLKTDQEVSVKEPAEKEQIAKERAVKRQEKEQKDKEFAAQVDIFNTPPLAVVKVILPLLASSDITTVEPFTLAPSNSG